MGPMALGDLVGQELFWKQRKACFLLWRAGEELGLMPSGKSMFWEKEDRLSGGCCKIVPLSPFFESLRW